MTPHPPGDLASLASVSMALRAPAFAFLTVAVSAAGHLAAGGSAPGLGTLALLTVLVALTWQVTARREQSLARLVGSVATAQLVLHHALASGHAAVHQHHHEAAAGPSGSWMVAAHAVAGLVVAWWLRRGEAAAWRLARRGRRLVRAVFVRLAALPPLALPVPSRPDWPEAGCTREILAVRSTPRRGPPVLA